MHAQMTILTDTKKAGTGPHPPPSQRLAAGGKGAVTHVRNMKWAPSVCEVPRFAQGFTNEVASLDMILGIWKQIA